MDKEELLEVIRSHQKEAPVPVFNIARAMGLTVLRARWPDEWQDKISGQIQRIPETDQYRILLNAAHPLTRQRFTLAHEIAHFVHHKHLIGDGITHDALYRSPLSTPLEREANRLAGNILMPWSLLWPKMFRAETDVRELAAEFKVSPVAMAIQTGIPYEP